MKVSCILILITQQYSLYNLIGQKKLYKNVNEFLTLIEQIKIGRMTRDHYDAIFVFLTETVNFHKLISLSNRNF